MTDEKIFLVKGRKCYTDAMDNIHFEGKIFKELTKEEIELLKDCIKFCNVQVGIDNTERNNLLNKLEDLK